MQTEVRDIIESREDDNNQLVAMQDTTSVPGMARFFPPQDADSLADALIAGQLSPRTRCAYASDLTELVTVLETWNLRLPDVTKDHLYAYRS